MSFQEAAAELNVTPAALSFQIKSLEQHLGTPVFHRLNRAVELTEAGRVLAPPGVKDGFETLTTAWRAALRLQDNRTLNVTAGPPAFTAKWLAPPRLYDFARAHPDIDLRFSASLRMMDFTRDEVDVAIRFGSGDDSGLYSLPLRREWMTPPVMTPEMARQFPTPPESLRDAPPILFDESIDFLKPACDWPTWFRAVGMDYAPPDHGPPRFSQADHAVDAAISGGAGVVLGRRAMVVRALHEGTLVAPPYKIALLSQARFRFLCQKGSEDRPQIKAFRDWVLSELETTAYVSEALTYIPVEDVAPPA